jgi:hypothetical protein
VYFSQNTSLREGLNFFERASAWHAWLKGLGPRIICRDRSSAVSQVCLFHRDSMYFLMPNKKRHDRGPFRTAATLASIVISIGIAMGVALLGQERNRSNPSQSDSSRAEDSSAGSPLSLAPQHGDADAILQMAERFAEGHGVAQDEAQAVRLFREAAQRGHAVAQLRLGVMLENGRGGPRDFVEAAIWYRKAAEQGLPKAQSL